APGHVLTFDHDNGSALSRRSAGQPLREVALQTCQVGSCASERDMAVRPHKVLCGLADAEPGERLAGWVAQRVKSPLAGQPLNGHQARITLSQPAQRAGLPGLRPPAEQQSETRRDQGVEQPGGMSVALDSGIWQPVAGSRAAAWRGIAFAHHRTLAVANPQLRDEPESERTDAP